MHAQKMTEIAANFVKALYTCACVCAHVFTFLLLLAVVLRKCTTAPFP